jgi:hypothetical protein
MEITRVDPRTGGWEEYGQRYRVYFWEQGFPPPSGARGENVGYASDEYEVSGVNDVFEVIAWANRNSGARQGVVYPGSDRTYTLYAVVDRGDNLGLVHLAGVDPTSTHPRFDLSKGSSVPQ